MVGDEVRADLRKGMPATDDVELVVRAIEHERTTVVERVGGAIGTPKAVRRQLELATPHRVIGVEKAHALAKGPRAVCVGSRIEEKNLAFVI